MFRIVVWFLVVCLGSAVAGAAVTGMLGLTLVALAGLLVGGAAAVSTCLPHEGAPTTPAGRPELRLVTSAPEDPPRSHGQDGGELRQAV